MQLAVVFDRKKVADNKTKKGLVQIRVCYDRHSWYLGTGVKVLKYQWNDKTCKCQRVDTSGVKTDEYNEKIELMLDICNKYDTERMKNGWAFDVTALKRRFEGGVSDKFMEWAVNRMAEKKGILKAETLRAHKSCLGVIEESGFFSQFSDLTLDNIIRFEEWMIKEKKYAPQTKWSKHKVLKIYIGEAKRMGKIKVNPYDDFRTTRGAALKKRIISEKEMQKILQAKIPKSYEKTRDIMRIQYMTGLAYVDLYSADFNSLVKMGDVDMLIGNRQKTDMTYYVPIYSEVKKLLKKYGGKVPEITNQQLNVRLKEVCRLAGIKDYKEITSHAFRKGAGSYLLRQGVRMETVSKFLGHSNMKVTESIYAQLDVESIAKEIGEKITL